MYQRVSQTPCDGSRLATTPTSQAQLLSRWWSDVLPKLCISNINTRKFRWSVGRAFASHICTIYWCRIWCHLLVSEFLLHSTAFSLTEHILPLLVSPSVPSARLTALLGQYWSFDEQCLELTGSRPPLPATVAASNALMGLCDEHVDDVSPHKYIHAYIHTYIGTGVVAIVWGSLRLTPMTRFRHILCNF